MKMIVGGYHIAASVARILNKNLGIDDSQFEDDRMYWPINDWLADNKLNILAGCHRGVKRSNGTPCVFFLTQFHERGEEMQTISLSERDEDKVVKKWLENNGAIDVHWASIEDLHCFTTMGTEPIKVNRAQWIEKRITWEEYRAQRREPSAEVRKSLREWRESQIDAEREQWEETYGEPMPE